MIRRPSDAWPADLLNEYRHVARGPWPPIEIRVVSEPDGSGQSYKIRCQPSFPSSHHRFYRTGQDYAGLLACCAWLREGPKITDVTEEQYQALSQVEVRLGVTDFCMPYPTLLVNLPPGKMHEYVILHKTTTACGVPLLIGASVSSDHRHDIITVARESGQDVEVALSAFHSQVTAEEGTATHAGMRVAANMALAMTNFGCQASYVFPGEAAQERKYIGKGDRPGRDGRRASDRLREQPVLVTLDRNVRLAHHTGPAPAGGHTGRQMPFHWRRGHWRKARVGEGRTGTRLVLVRPCMVRADLMTAPVDETTTTYHG